MVAVAVVRIILLEQVVPEQMVVEMEGFQDQRELMERLTEAVVAAEHRQLSSGISAVLES